MDYWSDLSEFKQHPIYERYLANKEGIIINKFVRKTVRFYDARGYKQFRLNFHGKNKALCCHRFVFECFCGIIPEKMQVDHLNANKTDNRLSNLQLLTSSQNTIKSYKDNPTRKSKVIRTVKSIDLNTKDEQEFRSSCQAGRALDIEPKVIRCIAAKEPYRKSAKSRTTGVWYTFEYLE